MRKTLCPPRELTARWIAGLASALWSLLLMVGLTGCQTAAPEAHFSDVKGKEALKTADTPAELVLHEGDLLRVSFPGTPNLNSPAAQQIRRDGTISLPLIGEYKAAGKSAHEIEKELLELYKPSLVTKEVTVSVESSAYGVYVSGAVLRPGKLQYDRPVGVLEAIMEAGVDYSKANLKKVVVLRHEGSRLQRIELNVKGLLQGTQQEPFMLKPADMVFVPERFNWF